MGQPRDLMDRFTAAMIGHDLEALRDLYAVDAVVTGPDSGALHGIDAIMEYHQGTAGAFSDMSYDPTGAFETEDCAIDQGEMVGRHTGQLKAPDGRVVEPTGRQVRVRSVDIARVRDGRIVRHDFYFDLLDMLTQLGLVEAPATHAT